MAPPSWHPDEAVYLYPDPRVWICVACRAAVRPGDGITRHFRSVHALKGSELSQVISRCAEQQAEDPHEAEIPEDGSTAIAQLPTLSGYSCTGCRYLTVNRKNIITHNNRGLHGVTGAGWTKVLLQTFSQGRYARYWVVVSEAARPGSATRTAGGDDDDDNRAWEAMVERQDRRLAEGDKAMRQTAEAPGGADTDSAWVTELGWAKHLRGKDLMQLHAASAAPPSVTALAKQRDGGSAEQRLFARLGASFDRVVIRCTARLELVPNETLRWLNSIDANRPASRAFGLKQSADTMDRYRNYWKRYLCYCVRAWQLGRAGAEAARCIRFSDAQWANLDEMCGSLADEQLAGGEERTAEANGGSDKLDRQVFEFCVCSIKQKLAFDVYVNPLLHFSAVLGIDGNKAAWKRATHYTGQLAGILWCARLLMLEHGFEQQPAEADGMEFEAVEEFTALCCKWLVDGTYTPVSTMIRWMSYGKGHREHEGGTGRVMWDADGKALDYLGDRITVEEFCETARVVAQEMKERLDGLVGGGWAALRKTVDLKRISDSLMFEGPGRSFATNPRNAWLQPGYRTVAELYRTEFWRKDGGWKVRPVRAYLARLRTFKRVLLAATHIWGGQPGRGPELMTMRFCDTQQLLRNVFVVDGQVMLVTDRDKNKAIRGIGRKVARFLPRDVGEAMVAYIAWLVPFEALLYAEAGVYGPAAAEAAASCSVYGRLWKDGRRGCWNTEELTGQLKRLTGANIGAELGTAAYRHVAIDMGRKVRGIAVRQVETELAGYEIDPDAPDADTGEVGRGRKRQKESIWDLQSTHGSKIARDFYALDIRFPHQLQPQLVACFREVSCLWHGFLEGAEGAGSEGGGLEPGKRVVKRKAGDIDAVSRRQESGEAESRAKKNRQRWKGSIGSSGAMGDGQEAGKTGDIGALADRGLRMLFGHQARWRLDEQREGMKRIMGSTGTDVLLLVLPTGGGKSVFFMLPAVVEDGGTSIVVVPFVALMEDLVARAEEFGVDCLQWQSDVGVIDGEPRRPARLVVVSADLAGTAGFVAYAGSLRTRGLLRRIFVDECHTVIMDAGYRERLEELTCLHRYEVPIVLLTATMPVGLEPWFRRLMLAEDACVLRASSVKRNIRYRVVNAGNGRGAVDEEVSNVVLRIEQRMEGDQKGVVYCRSRDKCEALAERIGCGFYHSQMGGDRARRAALQEWAAGGEKNRWIVATTGLGTGVDIKGIVAVVHAEQPYGLVDFVQQTGRGGRRDGEEVESVIVWDGKAAWYDRQGSDVEQVNRQAMGWFMESEGCRRVALGMFMDGVGRECEEVGGLLCDRCVERAGEQEEQGSEEEAEEEAEEAVSPENRVKRHFREVYQRVAVLRQWLDEVEDKCGVCYFLSRCLKGRSVGYDHEAAECPLLKGVDYAGWRRRIRYADYRCCWTCGLPYSWCQEGGGQVYGGTCGYMHTLTAVVWVVTQGRALQQAVLKEFGVDAGDEVKFAEWVGRSRRMYGLDVTNGFAVWDFLVWKAR